MSATTQAAGGQQSKRELAPIHDFGAKLRQPALIDRLERYVRWQVDARREIAAGKTLDEVVAMAALDVAPVSINLDVTTACNYACDHCVDMEILNTGIKYNHDRLLDSLRQMAERGLKTVIVIGGGEPTVYPKFEETMLFMKDLGLSLGLVTNGSYMSKVLAIADRLDARDWVRLSLDSGSDPLFQAMHKPKKPVTLDEICEGIPPIKDKNPAFRIGFSFIIVWKDCEANETAIHENVHEIVLAAERARRYRFDYISYKPFLTRAESNNAEVVDLVNEEERVDPVMARIRHEIDQAKALETDAFKVIESTNLRVLENGTYKNYTHQPEQCHMTVFRQVMSPLGLYNCPVYRHVPHARIGDKHGYQDAGTFQATQQSSLKLLHMFNAREECKEVTCLYNNANWFIEDLIENPEKLEALEPTEERGDAFL